MYIAHSWVSACTRLGCICNDRQIFKFGSLQKGKLKRKFKNSARAQPKNSYLLHATGHILDRCAQAEKKVRPKN